MFVAWIHMPHLRRFKKITDIVSYKHVAPMEL